MSSSDDLISARGRRWRHRTQDKSDDEEGSSDTIKNTESKKSVTTSVYSGDFTDCGSERNVNASRDSYDTDWEESDDNVSVTSCQLHRVHSRVNIPRQSTSSLVDSEVNVIARVDEQQNFNNTSSTSINIK